MTLSDLVNSTCIQGSVSVCQVSENDSLEWARRSDHEPSDLSNCDISWATNMEVKYIYAMRGTIYIEVETKD